MSVINLWRQSFPHALVLKVNKKDEFLLLRCGMPKKNVPTKHRCGTAILLLWKILLSRLGIIKRDAH